jgi:RNA 3'-terminal phosphate cyclase-like protein
LTADAAYEDGTDPDQLGHLAAKRLLDEIQFGGVVSSNYQWFLLNLMACSERKTSNVKLGRVSSYTIGCLRHLKDFLGVIFEIDESQS